MTIPSLRIWVGSVALLTCAAAVVAQVAPACLEDVAYPGGACDKRPSNGTHCPDSISGPPDPCTYTQTAASGLSQRVGYDRSCTYRPGYIKPDGTCGVGIFVTVPIRCHEGSGNVCSGGGCGAC